MNANLAEHTIMACIQVGFQQGVLPWGLAFMVGLAIHGLVSGEFWRALYFLEIPNGKASLAWVGIGLIMASIGCKIAAYNLSPLSPQDRIAVYQQHTDTDTSIVVTARALRAIGVPSRAPLTNWQSHMLDVVIDYYHQRQDLDAYLDSHDLNRDFLSPKHRAALRRKLSERILGRASGLNAKADLVPSDPQAIVSGLVGQALGQSEVDERSQPQATNQPEVQSSSVKILRRASYLFFAAGTSIYLIWFFLTRKKEPRLDRDAGESTAEGEARSESIDDESLENEPPLDGGARATERESPVETDARPESIDDEAIAAGEETEDQSGEKAIRTGRRVYLRP